MHKTAMEKSFAQIRMAATISRSGLSDAQIAVVLGVSQPTVSRLRNCLIQKVGKYQLALDRHLGTSPSDGTGEIRDLFAMAMLSPPLRNALIAIQRLMQENA